MKQGLTFGTIRFFQYSISRDFSRDNHSRSKFSSVKKPQAQWFFEYPV
jgi:hypothetical protein